MTRWQRWSFNLVTAASALSGLVYLWMRYLIEADDPFSVINHPWQPVMLNVHLLTAPVIILLFGIVFQSHIARKIDSPDRMNRRSGWTSLLTFGLMAASGYVLQVVTSPLAVQILWGLHLASSGVFVVGYAVHLVLGLDLLRTFLRRRPTTITVPGS